MASLGPGGGGDGVDEVKKNQGDGKKKVSEMRDAFRTIKEISDLLRTGLDPEMLATCIRLIEEGANPDVLARLVAEMSREAERLDNQENNQSNN